MRVSVPMCMPVMTSLACEDISDTCNGLDMALLLSQDAQVQPRKSLLCGNTRVCPSGAIWASLSEANIPSQTPPPPPPQHMGNSCSSPSKMQRGSLQLRHLDSNYIHAESSEEGLADPSTHAPSPPHTRTLQAHAHTAEIFHP